MFFKKRKGDNKKEGLASKEKKLDKPMNRRVNPRIVALWAAKERRRRDCSRQ